MVAGWLPTVRLAASRSSAGREFLLPGIGDETLIDRLLAGKFARTTDRFPFLPRSSLGWLLVKSSALHLPEHAFALHLLFQYLEGLVDVVVSYQYLQVLLLVWAKATLYVTTSETSKKAAPLIAHGGAITEVSISKSPRNGAATAPLGCTSSCVLRLRRHAPELKSALANRPFDWLARKPVRRIFAGCNDAERMPRTETAGQFRTRRIIRERSQFLARIRLEDIDPHGCHRVRNQWLGHQPRRLMMIGVAAAALPSGDRRGGICRFGRLQAQALRDLESPHGDLAGPRVGLSVEGDFLALLQSTDARALERGGVNENVLAAVVRLNEAETLVAVVELYCAPGHKNVLSLTVCTWDQAHGFVASSRFVEFGESLKRAPGSARRSGPVVRPNVDAVT